MNGKLVMTNEVVEEGYKVIAANNGEFLSSKDIYYSMNPAIRETVNYDTFRTSFSSKVKRAHPDIQAVRGFGYKIVKPAAEVKTDPKPITGEITKYIKDIHKDAGDIWTVRRSDGRIDYFLELARNDVNVIGVPLYLCDEDPSKSTCWKEPYDISVKLHEGWLFGNAMNIKTKPRKYFIERYAPAPDDWFKYVKDMISTVLDISKPATVEPEAKTEDVYHEALDAFRSYTGDQSGVTVDGVFYSRDDIISLITERDMYQMFYKDLLSISKGGRS